MINFKIGSSIRGDFVEKNRPIFYEIEILTKGEYHNAKGLQRKYEIGHELIGEIYVWRKLEKFDWKTS